MSAKISVKQDGQASISGDLTFATVTALCKQIPASFVDAATFTIDLSTVKNCDSASLVFLVMVIRFLQQENKTVSFTRLPQTVLTLIKLYNLQNLITVK